MKVNGPLRISEAAQRTGLSPKTIRYYEEIGLTPRPKRSEVMTGYGYRLYFPADVARLSLVHRMKGLGLPLKEVKELVKAADGGCCPTVDPKLAKFIKNQVAGIDRKIQQLAQLRKFLSAMSRTSPSTVRAARSRKAQTCHSSGCLCSTEEGPAQAAWQEVRFRGRKARPGPSSGCCEPHCGPETCPPGRSK